MNKVNAVERNFLASRSMPFFSRTYDLKFIEGELPTYAVAEHVGDAGVHSYDCEPLGGGRVAALASGRAQQRSLGFDYSEPLGGTRVAALGAGRMQQLSE